VRTRNYIFILSAVALFLFFYGLGDMTLTDPDETFYAESAKEMTEANDWVTPMMLGKPQFEKPVFYYWLIMISYKVFGVNEFAARFPSACFGLIGVIGMFFLGRAIFSPLCGLMAGLITATSIEYLVLARACVTDMVLAVFILYAFLFFILARVNLKKRYYFLSSVMVALAVLTKGPVGLFIPVVVIGAYLFTGGRWRSFKEIPVLTCAIAFLIISLPWYIIVAKLHGSAFFDEFFGFHNFVRFIQPEHTSGISPFFYIPVIFGGFFPWSAFLPLGVWAMYRSDNFISRFPGYKLFLGLWFLTVFIFFSVSQTKLVTYIFPLFPVLSVVTARLWERSVRKLEGVFDLPKFMAISHYLYVLMGIGAIIGVTLVINRKFPPALPAVMVCEGIFLIGMILSLYFLLRKRRLFLFVTIAFTVVLMVLPISQRVLPAIEVYVSSKALTDKIRELAGEGDPIGGEDDHRRGIAFYSGRKDVEDLHAYSGLVEFVARKERVWGIIQVKHYEELKKGNKELYTEPVLRTGKYVLITNQPYTGKSAFEK